MESRMREIRTYGLTRGEIASATPGARVSTLHRKAHCGKPYAGNFVARFGLLFLVAGALQVHAGK